MGYVESLQVSTVLAYVFMISMNVISNTMPWNDKTNADVSNKYPTKYAPRVLSLTFQVYTCWLDLFHLGRSIVLKQFTCRV